MESTVEKEKKLWLTFFSLTEEMLKFLEREDIDMFLQLFSQREKLQKLLEALGPNVWTKTDEGQQLYQRLKPIDMQIQYKARLWLNRSKHKNEVARAYDSLGAQLTGRVFNRDF